MEIQNSVSIFNAQETLIEFSCNKMFSEFYGNHRDRPRVSISRLTVE